MTKDKAFILLIVVPLFIMTAIILSAVLGNVSKGVSNTEITYKEPQGDLRTISYYSAIDSCHTGIDCLMANGERAYVGAVACPRELELGTVVNIDGIDYTCADRTSLTYDGRYDIFLGYETKDYHEALARGLDQLRVIIK